MPFKLSNLNSNLALTLGYLNPALNNSAQVYKWVQRLLGVTRLFRFDSDPRLHDLQPSCTILHIGVLYGELIKSSFLN